MNVIRLYCKEHNRALWVTGLFAVIYSLIAFVNHHLFKTFALDLGVYTNALYDYGHFQFNDKGVFKSMPENLLSDHFDLYLMILAPFGWIFGEYTLQLFQILSILLGGLGVYHTVLKRFSNPNLALWAILSFLLSFSIYAALSFDYHSNVPAAMFVPWLFYFAETKQVKWMVFTMVLICLGKESESFWMVFVSIGLAILYRKESSLRNAMLLMSLFSMVYFLLIIKIVMPSMANSGSYDHYKFHALGEDYFSAFKFVLSSPLEFIKILLSNHSGRPEYDHVKTEFYVFALLSGGLIFIFRPAFLLMIAPLLVMKMCYDDPAAWSIDTHYSIEFAPILILGAFYVIGDISNRKIRISFNLALLIGLGISTFRYMDSTVYWHDYSRVRIYQKSHYVKNYDVGIVHNQIDLIPKEAIVAAQTPFVPHLAYRDRCYTLPIVKDAEYIVSSPSEEAMYPIIREELNKLIQDSLSGGRWQTIYRDTNVMVMRRKHPGN